MNLTLESPITNGMIAAMGKEMALPTAGYELAQKVADILGVNLYDVVTWTRDSEEKILCIFMEIILNGTVDHKLLSHKYKIYLPYMLNRLKDLHRRLKSDAGLRGKVLVLNSKLLSDEGL